MNQRKSSFFSIIKNRKVLIVINVCLYIGVFVYFWSHFNQPSEVKNDVQKKYIQEGHLKKGHSQEKFITQTKKSLACPDCNVILVSIDTINARHLPIYGYSRDTAPNITQLAEESMTFDNFIVQAYLTPVSMMSLFTAQYPTTNKFTSFHAVLNAEKPTLPKVFQQNGYVTAAIGSVPEFMYGRPFSKRENLIESFSQGFDHYLFTGHRNIPTDALAWMQKNDQQKFFLWIPIGTVHYAYGQGNDMEEKKMFDPPNYKGIFSPLKSIKSYETLFRIYKGMYYPHGNEKLMCSEIRWIGEPPRNTSFKLIEDEHKFIISRYDYGIYRTDRFIGQLVAQLKKQGLMEKTILIIHGIHGEEMGTHGYYGHYDIYDTEVRNALVIYHPKLKKKKNRIVHQIRGLDLTPSILEMVKLPDLPGAQGKSFLPILTGEEKGKRLAFSERIPLWEVGISQYRWNLPWEYREMIQNVVHDSNPYDISVRTNEWKLIYRKSRDIEKQISWWSYVSKQPLIRPEFELYNLSRDPLELENVVHQFPDIASELKEEIFKEIDRYDLGF